MKKFLCAFLLVAVLAGSAFAGSVNVGLLTQFSMTQSEFHTYMEAALSSGLWTMFTTDDRDPAFFVFYDSLIGYADGSEQRRSRRDRPSRSSRRVHAQH